MKPPLFKYVRYLALSLRSIAMFLIAIKIPPLNKVRCLYSSYVATPILYYTYVNLYTRNLFLDVCAVCAKLFSAKKRRLPFLCANRRQGNFYFFSVSRKSLGYFHLIDLKDSIQDTFRMFAIQYAHNLGHWIPKKSNFPS